jgi:hypothetical protein
MATRSESPVAYRLIKGLAMRQRIARAAPPTVFHVSGVNNILADVASRPVPGVASHFHLLEKSPNSMCPQTFLTIFDARYPLPQRRYWTNVQPPSALWYNVISTLRGQRLGLRQWMIALDEPHGPTGLPTPNSVESTPGCGTLRKPSNKPTSLPLPPGFELASSGTLSKLASNLWKKPSATWHKPSFWRATMTQGEPTVAKS